MLSGAALGGGAERSAEAPVKTCDWLQWKWAGACIQGVLQAELKEPGGDLDTGDKGDKGDKGK